MHRYVCSALCVTQMKCVVAVVYCLFIVPVFCTTATYAGVTETPNQTVLVTISGRPFTVKALSGVHYSRGLGICDRAFSRWNTKGIAYGWYSGLMLNEKNVRKQPNFHSGSEIYDQALEGMIRLVLEREVFNRLLVKYNVKMSKYIIPGSLETQAQSSAKADWLAMQQVDGVLVKGWNESEFARQDASLFPTEHMSATDEVESYHWIRSTPTVHFCMAHAFPRALSPTKPAPWTIIEGKSNYVGVAIGDIVARHRRSFAQRAALYGGRWQFAKVTCAKARVGTASDLQRLLDTTARKKGGCDLSTLKCVDQVLHSLGSADQIDYCTGVGPMIGNIGIASHTYGIPSGQFATGRLLGIRSIVQPNVGFIYVYPRQGKYWKRYLTGAFGPRTELFRIYGRYVLNPIVRKVLADAKPMRGLELPSGKWLVDQMLECSEYQPELFKRMPWPVPASEKSVRK